MGFAKEFSSGFFFAFAVLILFSSQPAVVFAAQEFASGQTPLILGSQNQNSSTLPSNYQNGSSVQYAPTSTPSNLDSSSCIVSRLSPTEAQGILDLTHDGFDGNRISDVAPSTSDKKADVKDLGKVNLVGKDNDSNTAVKVSAPQYAAPSNKFAFLNGLGISGPFGIGFIIDDTLRVGRCKDLPAVQCDIFGQGLSVRTSGVGFKQDLVNAFQSASGASKNLAESALSSTDYNKLQGNYFDYNNGNKDFTTGSFATGQNIHNSILTEEFTAQNSTTCNNSACIISSYSGFDKYFNAWLTTDMVVATVGPTLWQKANKLMTKLIKSSSADAGLSRIAGFSRIREKFVGTPEYFMKSIVNPSMTVGQARISRFKALVQEEGFDAILQDLYIGRKLFSSGAGGAITKLTAPDSPIWKMTPEKRTKFFEAIEHLRAYARENVTLIDIAKQEYAAAQDVAKAVTDPTLQANALRAAKIDYAAKISRHMDDWDNILALDFELWIKDKEELFSLGGTALRKNGPFLDNQGYVDLATAPPFNTKRVVQNFSTEGSWANWKNSPNSETFKIGSDGVSLQLYQIKPDKLVAENVALEDLKFHVAKVGGGTYSVRTPDGKYLPLNSSSIDYIVSQPILPGTVSIYESAYAPAGVLTPEDFANRITDKRISGRPSTALRNIEDLHNALVQNDFATRSYTSALDKQFAEEGDFLKKYYTDVKLGVYKGSVMPILYVNAKKGFGNEDYSAFMLPDTWSTLRIYQGTDKIFNDAFIDFFVNEGSDQGDMFKRMLNSAPFAWNKVIDLAAQTNQFTYDTLSKITGGYLGSGMRDTVGDVAIYSHNENCSGCVGSLKYDGSHLVLGFNAGTSMDAFLVEAASDETKQKTGTTLISYAHHSDLKGKTGDIDGEEIDLANSRADNKTCDQKLRSLGLGWAGASAGGVLGLAENAAYFAGFGPGLIASFAQQMIYGRDLQDCVDDTMGYYVHFYAPPEKEANKNKSTQVLSNENVTTAISDLSTKLDQVAKNNTASNDSKDSNNPIYQSLDKMKEQFNEFQDNAKQYRVLQANIELSPPNSGALFGRDVFYVWVKENMMPVAYRTDGKQIVTDGNSSVELNFAAGTLKVNGKTILGPDKADHVRMTAQDNRIPADVVPMTLNKIRAPNDNSTVFELSSFGQMKVRNAQVLHCIQQAVYDQTGIMYSGDELTQVFGDLKEIRTNNYSPIFARDGQIIMEGFTQDSPRYAGPSGSSFIIDGYWKSRLLLGENKIEAGDFEGMYFEHGSIVVNKQTNELVIWLRQYADSVLTNKDVKGLKATPATVIDPDTGCSVQAVNLEALPFQNDELGARKVDYFNQSMQHLGPFTQFTTPDKIYEFYAQRDATSGECKNYFRIRDRATGKILSDQQVIGGITQDADGTLHFKTADGQDHTLKFDAQNGVPTISYDKGPPETLLSAQGPNGSFWYDPEKGLWYPENGLQVPLNQAFKDNGAWFGTDSKGNVTGTPENKMTFNIGNQQQPGFSVPSMPETVAGLATFIGLFLLIAFIFTRRPKLRW